MVQLTIRIRDYVYSKDITVPTGGLPTGLPSITPPPVFTPPPPPTQETRIVKILPENTNRLPDANDGEAIKITATIYCKSGDTITKPRDTAYLLIDGAIADQKPITNGSVTFDWTATVIPINFHTICIMVNPSESCKAPGKDCKKILVSGIPLNPTEQLSRERASATEQRKLLESARKRLREEIVGGELTVPGQLPQAPTTIPEIPTAPPTLPSTPTAPPTPDVGNINITGIPIPIDPAVPIFVYLDETNVGRVYELPKTIVDIPIGNHLLYMKAGDFTSSVKTATVIKGTTSNVTL